jgi:hypothetical protein
MCLIVCGLLIVLWVRSYSWEEGIVWGITDKKGFVFGSMNGVVTVQFVEVAGDKVELSEWFVDSYPPGEAFWLPRNLDEITTFGFHLSLYSSGLWFVAMPHWFPILLTAIFTWFPCWVNWRFSLRAMFIATTLLAVVFGILVVLAR